MLWWGFSCNMWILQCQNEILWFLGKLRGVISVHFIVIYLTHYTFPLSFKIFFVCECIYVQTRMKLQRNWARLPSCPPIKFKRSEGKWLKRAWEVPCSRKKVWRFPKVLSARFYSLHSGLNLFWYRCYRNDRVKRVILARDILIWQRLDVHSNSKTYQQLCFSYV